MTRRHIVRNAGAIGVTALFGLGCTHAGDNRSPTELRFSERLDLSAGKNWSNDNSKAGYPRPHFGPLWHSDDRPSQIARPVIPATDRRGKLRRTLLASTSGNLSPETAPTLQQVAMAVAEPTLEAAVPPGSENIEANPSLSFLETAPRPEVKALAGTITDAPIDSPSIENTSVPQTDNPKADEIAPVPSLALAMPARRVPVPMVSASPPRNEAPPAAAVNDSEPEPLALPDTLEDTQLASVAPPPRARTSLGLGQPNSPAPDNQTTLAPDRSGGFTVSDEPPELSYQDELILEIQVKGVRASDTILAYGTREGVYLPIGTLARILDLAITVGENGNFATGWVLDPNRTLTIDLESGTLDLAGETSELAAGAAVAFDGELYLLADRIADFMPLTVDTDLRAQTVTLTTLEPFPFEERMKREADRARLANRQGAQPEKIFARQDTPFLLASIPVGDVDLRAISDSTFGSRAELDLQFTGDLGYLTAETFISADTKFGLTTSLVTVGRQDPDGDLLGPLSATAFAAGDVATVSMPIGLRSVSGRGFAASNAPFEAISVFEKIDLRGILPDGFEVELYRNDILIGSTREVVNGQYEFLQVPVDFGVNVFRLVFFGPQGQRSEEVRRISVGDGRLPTGKLVYRFGAVQKDQNLLGVRPPQFIEPRDFGTFRASGELSYGVSSGITAVGSAAVFESADDRTRWISTAGIRTGLGGFALKADVAASDGDAYAISGGIGGRIGSSALTASHIEYTGDFIDETRGLGSAGLKRATELDFNTTLELGDPVSGFIVPLTARARRVESTSGLVSTDATVRASTRIAGVLASNTFDYNRTSFSGLESRSRLFGNFDLATLGRARTRGRLSLGYQILPDPDIVSAAVEVDHALDEDTAIRASLGYLFETQSAQIGLSTVREFDRFSLALDGNYAFERNEHSIGLRLGFSFGRDPLRGKFFIARPGLANGGIASVRAFRDLDGDGIFGVGDTALPDVSVVASNRTVATDVDGIAQLGNLSPGRGASLQIDGSTLPDIDLAPASEGMEIVPRPGRIHVADFPIVALSEVEGSVTYALNDSKKGVSGVRLKLRDADGKDVYFSKTEIDGYFFFERVRPGEYEVVLDEKQAERLDLCPAQDYSVTVGYEADLFKTDIAIGRCETIAVVTQ